MMPRPVLVAYLVAVALGIACGAAQHPPREFCSATGGPDGAGSWSWTVYQGNKVYRKGSSPDEAQSMHESGNSLADCAQGVAP